MAEEIIVRREKLDAFVQAGIEAYPPNAEKTATVQAVLDDFEAFAAQTSVTVLCGRVFTIRVHGGLLFADLGDESGRMQIALKEDSVGADVFARFRDGIDPGDFVEARGTFFTTKRGEKTMLVESWRLLAKALLPLPEKWHGLADIELRQRERELDILSNAAVRTRFVQRSRAIRVMRSFLDEHGFMEVETPILQNIAGGANARPFVTHHHALDIDLYLRIAPELYLKRLLVGGFERVFEIGRCFRNEGIDYAHNPEFTMIELYWAYAEKEAFLSFLEDLIRTVARETIGHTPIAVDGEAIDFAAPWKRTTFREAIQDACGLDIDTLRSEKEIVAAVKKKKLAIDFTGCIGLGELYDALYKHTARPSIVQPTWVLDYPVEMKPLARRHPTDPTKSATAQLVIRGAEVVNAYYHELNDPVDQRARFEEQQRMREEGSTEAQPMDEPFLRALEHGMPPAAGMGIGIDRLLMLMTGAENIKETILFPTLRPEDRV